MAIQELAISLPGRDRICRMVFALVWISDQFVLSAGFRSSSMRNTNDFFEEIAKYRAALVEFKRAMRDRFGYSPVNAR